MNILAILIPASLFLGLLALAAFFWALRHDQFEDPKGQAARILSDRYDDRPAPDPDDADGVEIAEKEPAGTRLE